MFADDIWRYLRPKRKSARFVCPFFELNVCTVPSDKKMLMREVFKEGKH